jgi:hypothetical protein
MPAHPGWLAHDLGVRVRRASGRELGLINEHAMRGHENGR